MRGLCTEILDMHIGAEADVVGEVPSGMVRVIVNHDVVGVPQPAVAEGNIVRGYHPVPVVEPETPRAAAGQVPFVDAPKAAGEMSMLPRFVHVVACIVRAGVVTYPGLSIHVRNVGMAGLVAVVTLGVGGLGCA